MVNIYTDIDQLMALQGDVKSLGLVGKKQLRSLLQGFSQARIRGNGLDFDELRAYQWGDDPRHIDWKMTARLQQPYVKVFSEERETPMVILVDQRQDMFLGTQLMTKSYAAASLAGLFAWVAVMMGERVKLVVINDSERVETPAVSRMAQLPVLFQPLITFNQQLKANNRVESSHHMLLEALQWCEKKALNNGQLVVISDFIGMDDSGWRLMRRLNLRSSVIAVTVHDFLDKYWPEYGRYLVCEPGVKAEIDLGDGQINSKLAQFRQNRLQHIDEQLVQSGALSLQVNTSEPLVDQLAARLKGNWK